MIPDRSAEVLRAIVQDYIANREPVGSKALVERHGFDVSAATIRNDMALLEEEQLIAQPHTSSGRIPTDRGYRLFVDKLAEVKPLGVGERAAIESFLTDVGDLDELLSRTVRLLAQLTNQMALVQYPTLGRASVRSVEMVPVSDTRILLILVTDANRIQQNVVELGQAIDSATIAEMRAKLNVLIAGVSLSEVASRVIGFDDQFSPNLRPLASAVTSVLSELVDANRSEKLLVAGAANLARRGTEFGSEFSSLLDAVEQQVVMLKLMNELQSESNGVAVGIGRENANEAFLGTSFVVSGYQASDGARIGVLGPTRMDYSANMANVRAVARYLSKILDRQ
ncbi:MAG: heat-inducible transcriptional repressor HrcA [Micrococcales bacterium]